MSKGQRLNSFFNRARRKEKSYEWLEAAKLYEQALGAVGQEAWLRKGELREQIGYCCRQAAMQAESQEAFKERMQQAVEAYENAGGCYERLMDSQKTARKLRCLAVVKYLGHWLTSDPAEKRKLLDDCLALEAKALRSFEAAGNLLEYGRTYSALPHVFKQRITLEWSGQTRRGILERSITWGEKAIAALSKTDASPELTKAYFTLTTCQLDMIDFIADPEKQEQNRMKAVESLRKAMELAEGTGNALFLGLSNCSSADLIAPEEVRQKAEAALKCGDRTRDRRLIAWSLGLLTYLTHWKAVVAEDPAQWTALMEDLFRFYDRAHRIYASMPFLSALGGAIRFPCGYLAYYEELAERELVVEKRLDFLTKAEAAGAEALRLAEAVDSPGYVSITLAHLAGVKTIRAQVDSDLAEKRHHLEMALKFKERVCQIRDEVAPFMFFNRGVARTTLAKHKMDLADVEAGLEAKQRLLEDAVVSMEQGLKLLDRMMPYYEEKEQFHLYAVLRRDQDRCAALLVRLYHLTKTPEHLRQAIETSRRAIDSAGKLDLISRTAESYWQIAKIQALLKELLKAAESFQQASESYKKAAEKIPQLKGFYQDHAFYMQAWNEIEQARHHHAQGQYGRAQEHYEQAAHLHKSTERWRYLSPNYVALALVQEAEELSRNEHAEEAKARFEQAAQQFLEAKESLKTRLSTIEDRDEEAMVSGLVTASAVRRDYCLGRVALEEAKILDRQGRHAASSRRYAAAAETFQNTVDAMAQEADRQELRPLIYLSRAWQQMTRAEAEAAPDLYLEAAQRFDEAKQHSLDEKAKLLALGHSYFCKAMEAGTRFEVTRDMATYSTAKKRLEAAANHYVRAGFKTASEYARATRRLFDAYLYMYKAETETDPATKARFYRMAEKLLQASAGAYTKAKHTAKGEEVQRLLDSVKEERQLAMSLAEVLRSPTITSTTTSFVTPTQTQEQAVGLERFEHADVQANLILRVKEVRVGEDIRLAIEVVNAGKAPALLIKVDEVIPEGFEITEVPAMYTFEDSYINLKGKRLNPLKTEDVKVIINPRSKGTHVIKPRILYIDETGKYKSHEPEPVTITVKELGIRGWIKGEN
jgi:uncharacterized repeat protein (TIGR01451 family)